MISTALQRPSLFPSWKCSGPAFFRAAKSRPHRSRERVWVAMRGETRRGSCLIPTGRANFCSSIFGVALMLEIKGTKFVPVDFDPFGGASTIALPLTVQQSEVWVESQMGREASCAFNQCFVLHLKGPLS